MAGKASTKIRWGAAAALLLAGWAPGTVPAAQAPGPEVPAGRPEAAPGKLWPAVERLLELSGLRDQLRAAPELVARDAEAQAGPLPPERRRALAEALRQAYDPRRLEEDVRAALARSLAGEEARLERALALMASPVARRMAELEEAAARPEAQAEMGRFLAGLAAAPPPRERRELVRRVMAAQQAVEALLDLQEATFRGMVAAFNPALPPERRLEGAELAEALREMRRRSRPQVERFLEGSLLYTYREASDAELERYARLLERPEARWATRILLAALEEAMGEAARRAGQAMRRLREADGPF